MTQTDQAPTERRPRARRSLNPLRRLPKGARHWFEYGILRTSWGLLGALPVEIAGAFVARITRFLGPRLGPNARLMRDMAHALPDRTDQDYRQIIRDMWDSLGRTAAEYPHLHRFDFFTDNPRVEIVGMDTVREVIALDRGGIFFSGHFANWELMPRAMVKAGLPATTVVRPVNNPLVNTYLEDLRRREVCPDLITKVTAARQIVQAIRQKKFIAMLVDQKIGEGVEVDFFGRPAMTSDAPARLAMKLGFPLIPAWIERTGPARYALHVYKPLEVPDTGDREADVLELTRRINAFFEERIRERPELWLWLHRRWDKRQ